MKKIYEYIKLRTKHNIKEPILNFKYLDRFNIDEVTFLIFILCSTYFKILVYLSVNNKNINLQGKFVQ